jgi:anti-sigma factor RsiW
MAEDREVAGIRCFEVLGRLSDYLDGELDGAARRQIDAHLAGCTWCEQFGGHMGQVVGRLRAERDGLKLDEAGAKRLAERLAGLK